MRPVHFKDANGTLLGGPAEKYGTDEDVVDLPVWRGEGHTISCWSMTWRERLQVLLTGRVWFHAAASNHPPVLLGTEDPFCKQKEKR